MRLKLQLNAAFRSALLLAGVIVFTPAIAAQRGSVDSGALLDKYCTSCHNSSDFAGGLDLQGASAQTIADTPETGEKLIKRLRAGMMPPAGEARPPYDTVQKLAQTLEQGIDRLDITAASLPGSSHVPSRTM